MLKKSQRWPIKWSKVKTLEDKPRGGWPFFRKLCEKYYRKSCKYRRNKSTKQKGRKNFNFTLSIKVSSTTAWDKLPKQVGKPLKRKKKAVHTSCTHGVRRICQLYTEGGPVGKPAHDVNLLETIWIIADETTYKDPAPKTLDELRQWLRFAWKNVTLDTLWGLLHSIPHRLGNVRKHTEWHSGY